MQISGRFVGDAYMRPVPFYRYIVISGRLQRAAYMPPLQMTRKIAITAKPRAGHTPPLPRVLLKCVRAADTPSFLFIISYLLFLIYYLDTLVFLRGLCYPRTGLAPKYCAVLPICRRRQQEEN